MSHVYDDQIVLPGLQRVLGLTVMPETETGQDSYYSAPLLDLDTYDRVIVCMSGGKDSLACLLHLIESGVDLARVELWHHEIDGREGSSLMDWSFMAEYNRQLAGAFGVSIYYSWLDGGFEGEMLKQNAYSRPHKFETPEGIVSLERNTNREPATRMRFPQQSANLQTRWCSSALKVDVARRALNNQPRFNGRKVLFITGERREESANRAKYYQLQVHSCDRRGGKMQRHVDAWRPVLDWPEEKVWEILERHNLIPPVPYRLGWNRSSCMTCIFNNARIWATIVRYFPERASRIQEYENQFGVTISRKRMTVIELSKTATPLEIDDVDALEQSTRFDYTLPILAEPGAWKLPAGAFLRDECGAP